MFFYEYKCPQCKHIERQRREIDLRDEPCVCSKCAAVCVRLIGAQIMKYGNQKEMSNWERIKNRNGGG